MQFWPSGTQAQNVDPCWALFQCSRAVLIHTPRHYYVHHQTSGTTWVTRATRGITGSFVFQLTTCLSRKAWHHLSSFYIQLLPWSDSPLDVSLFISYRGSINEEVRVVIWFLEADVRRGILPSTCLTQTVLAHLPIGQVKHVIPEIRPSKLASMSSIRCSHAKLIEIVQCVSTRQQKPKGIPGWLETVISFYAMTLQSNCAQNDCFYCLNTFLVLEHPGGFNCACNFSGIKEGD